MIYFILTFFQILMIRSNLSFIQNDDPEQATSLALGRRKRDWGILTISIQENERGPFSKKIEKTEFPSDLPVAQLPRALGGLRRKKRDWEIPTISIQENEKGPFPKKIVKIQSSLSKEIQVVYSIAGEGADKPPKGLFTVDRNTGILYVTKPLDREVKSSYLLEAHAVAVGDGIKEKPAEITINVLDANDNRPLFTQEIFTGSVSEASVIDNEFMTVTATDADDAVNTNNADIRYFITKQDPPLPNPNMFTINPVTGGIRVNTDGLDREKYPEYTLDIQAVDSEGSGLITNGKAIITVTDSNDNAPQFAETLYTATVPENKVGYVVVTLTVTDGDEPQSPAWAATFRIINGIPGGAFSISTGPNKQEGIITTGKSLDFERNSKYTLLVVAENDVPFAKPVTTSTATVIVNVEDVNEAPVFDPVEKIIVKPEDLAVGSELTVYTATDPDMAKKQKVVYHVGSDPAGWLNIDREIGLLKVKSPLDRESLFVRDDKYKALIFAMDNDQIPMTGTGTLIIEVEDVNDNAPIINNAVISICPYLLPLLLSVRDEDGPGYSAPFQVELIGDSNDLCTATMTESGTTVMLMPKMTSGHLKLELKVSDFGGLYKNNILSIQMNEENCVTEMFCLKT